jgi:hypothetical protein
MANPTLFQLATTTVGSGGTSSVTFSAIPQVYTDLLIKASARNTDSGSTYFTLTFNGNTSGYSGKRLEGNGSAASSGNNDVTNNIQPIYIVSSTYTANTFSNNEIYIPNYASSNYKSLSSDNVSENNATSAFMNMTAHLWSNSSAVTSITLTSVAGNFVQYSTFTLYGVRNY